jgi:hypothetical protein
MRTHLLRKCPLNTNIVDTIESLWEVIWKDAYNNRFHFDVYKYKKKPQQHQNLISKKETKTDQMGEKGRIKKQRGQSLPYK